MATGAVLALAALAFAATAARAPADETGHLSGLAFYADHEPDAGVEVVVYAGGSPPRHSTPVATVAHTDEGGHWDAGTLPAGAYWVSYRVATGGDPGRPDLVSVGSDVVTLDAGADVVLSTLLAGPKPLAVLTGTVLAAEGWPSEGYSIEVVGPDGVLGSVGKEPDGRFRASLATGTYTLNVSSESPRDYGEAGSATVTVRNGTLSEVTVSIRPLPVPPGTVAHRSKRQLGWLNRQRARWGLPAGLVEVPLWSQACAAHDAYLAANRLPLQHGEREGARRYSAGGRWAGANSVLAPEHAAWSAAENPWNDAPIHLIQMLSPSLSLVGLDDSKGNQCLTTWPGMRRSWGPPGTVLTYPGAGRRGIPPAERVLEVSPTPNEVLKLPPLAGRALFVYQSGTESPFGGWGKLRVLSATLRSRAGRAKVRWADQTNPRIGSALTGAVIVPVKPLRPRTRYTATVRLAALRNETSGEEVAPVTHTWSFRTGRANPSGCWCEHTRHRRAPRR